MKELKFYKYFEDESRHLYFWEAQNSVNMDKANKIKEDLLITFPDCEIRLLESVGRFCTINIKFYNEEDNALFCLKIGGV